MVASTAKVGLRLPQSRRMLVLHTTPRTKRGISSAALSSHLRRPSPSAATPSAGSTTSSFFTPSLCRTRQQSTDASPPRSSAAVLDWNTFFRLRASRRRFGVASSIVSAIATTGAAVTAFSEIPGMADQVGRLIPTDPFISMGVATFGATFFGWLIGPAFGNTVWRMLNRRHLPEFTLKERTFFERIKRHRVNPSGASTNNPVPDYYGEKIGSVSGYRRWLKDQRAFNRKKGGNYPG